MIGFTTHSGTVTAASGWDNPAQRKYLRPALPESYEALFHQTGVPNFLLRLDKKDECTHVLQDPRLERAIGVIYLPRSERASHYFYAQLPLQFDLLLHYDVAVQLRHDADEVKAFTRSGLSWESHATKVEEIKGHINKAGELLSKLENEKGAASPWQQQAIERITPMLKELASNTESTIDHLNQKPKLLHTGPYKEYVEANYEVASSLEELISDYVDYGKSKARSEELASKLEVPKE